MINLTRKFSILSPKILRHRIELRQDHYLSMHKLSNHAARARDLAPSKTLWSLLKSRNICRRVYIGGDHYQNVNFFCLHIDGPINGEGDGSLLQGFYNLCFKNIQTVIIS